METKVERDEQIELPSIDLACKHPPQPELSKGQSKTEDYNPDIPMSGRRHHFLSRSRLGGHCSQMPVLGTEPDTQMWDISILITKLKTCSPRGN